MGKLCIIFVVLPLMLVPGLSGAEIYSYVDKNGVTHFTNMPNGQGNRLLTGRTPVTAVRAEKRKRVNRRSYYRRIVEDKSIKYNLEPSLINAVIETESNWDYRAVSRKGAQGLMQLMPSTSKSLNVTNPFSPEENIDAGSRYLRRLLDRFHGDVSLALAAYNAGPETIEHYGGIPPFRETREYVKRVISKYTNGSGSRSASPIYKVKTKDGTVVYTNTPYVYKGASYSLF